LASGKRKKEAIIRHWANLNQIQNVKGQSQTQRSLNEQDKKKRMAEKPYHRKV
jgi:hypothetical protein